MINEAETAYYLMMVVALTTALTLVGYIIYSKGADMYKNLGGVLFPHTVCEHKKMFHYMDNGILKRECVFCHYTEEFIDGVWLEDLNTILKEDRDDN